MGKKSRAAKLGTPDAWFSRANKFREGWLWGESRPPTQYTPLFGFGSGCFNAGRRRGGKERGSGTWTVRSRLVTSRTTRPLLDSSSSVTGRRILHGRPSGNSAGYYTDIGPAARGGGAGRHIFGSQVTRPYRVRARKKRLEEEEATPDVHGSYHRAQLLFDSGGAVTQPAARANPASRPERDTATPFGWSSVPRP
ncbi:uncharacterized protein THITE_2127658 [Thermothielavioides terrestris NRRL 8126]|uniref:Uncharacterized protein n=1 Tax=Thermothielavioides terrestris (strain ATCC 38088 / NRRL 8126) TaxID=578455 RepID=G2QZ36_THETT|nr:uncharacterized protein THITE_2127658 [Thermothielavioides terrestris NRRL 8126]AEO65468.1 hypothetical protein THITE_2127658 [Thermothielavioides terrestris NRRL 8126]